jgi:outer membrane immunogenic protein
MKKLALTLTILTTFCALAYAGPEPYSGKDGKEMKQVAPAPPTCQNWSGFYIGGAAGYKFRSTDVHYDPTGTYDTTPIDQATLHDAGSGDFLDDSGFEAGGLIGFNYQVGCWVFGLEASGSYLWLSSSEDSGVITNLVQGYTPKDITTSFKTHYLATVAPRVGYAFGKWLPYVTGGFAMGDLDFSQRINNVPPNAFYQEGGNKTDLNPGWMVGGGLQYAVAEHWSVRAQYEYVDLGSVSFDAPGSAGFTDFSGHHEASLREHNASFAIIYGF